MISRLISARISEERMFDNSVSASKPWIALRSCANSIVYSAFRARDPAVTETFSMLNAISGKATLEALPNASAWFVDIASPKLYAPFAALLDKAGTVPTCLSPKVLAFATTDANEVLASL